MFRRHIESVKSRILCISAICGAVRVSGPAADCRLARWVTFFGWPHEVPRRDQAGGLNRALFGDDYCCRRSIGFTLGLTITEKAPTRAFSWLKALTSAFTFKTLLRHYAKWAPVYFLWVNVYLA